MSMRERHAAIGPLSILDGTSGPDSLVGGGGGDQLYGYAGNDTLLGAGGDDWMEPGSGNDSVNGGAGTDSISYAPQPADAATVRGIVANLVTGIVTDCWNGTDTIAGIEWVYGSTRSDRITGNTAGNVLDGGRGNDTLLGGGGEDWLQPGPGSDSVNGGTGVDVVSYVDSEGDAVLLHGVNANLATGAVTDGWDGADTLSAVENLVGSSLDDTLAGAGHHTLLDGRAGNDHLSNAGIVYSADPNGVFVNLGGVSHSFNQVTVAARRALDGFGDTDVLGTGVVSGYATDYADTWFGSNQNAYVLARAGDDYVQLGSGHDWVLAGSGADTVNGGGGFDAISYDDDGYDGAGAAFQGVQVDLAAGTAIDGWNDPDVLIGIEDVYGSALDDSLGGSAGGNYLEGGAGNDTLNGLGGNDYLLGGAGDDSVDGGAGQDFFAVSGSTLADYSIVDNGNGSSTITDLNPGDGDDGTDTVRNVELLGLAELGTAANDTLQAGGVEATLAVGLDGDDTYVLHLGGDHVVEHADQGTDTVRADISRVLEPNVENLVLTGSGDLSGSGNNSANALTGNTGSNTLDGGAGADTMNGGDGDDTYYVDNPGDSVDEASAFALRPRHGPAAGGSNIDTVISQISYTLRANVENLELSGSAEVNGVGNGLDNLMSGNGARNLLRGVAGIDLIDGGAGNDTLDGGAGNDTLGGGGGADSFLFSTAPAASGNQDRILDFTPQSDRLRLDDDAFSAFDAAVSTTLAATAFYGVAGSTAHDADDRIIYNTVTGGLFYDPDGTGAQAALRFAVLAGAPALSAGDFLIVG